jgi:hypothetical protein
MSPSLFDVTMSIESISNKVSFSSDTRQVFKINILKKIDVIPDQKNEDNFMAYLQHRFISAPFEVYRNETFVDGTRRNIVFQMNTKNKNVTETKNLLIFTTGTYCCLSSKFIKYCTSYHRLNGICLVVDLLKENTTQNGCFKSDMYRETSYEETTLDSLSSLTTIVLVREVHDPWYQIPNIIGFLSNRGRLPSWGISKNDRLEI